jgi:hypothetical protein
MHKMATHTALAVVIGAVCFGAVLYGLKLTRNTAVKYNMTMIEVIADTDCYVTTPRNPVCLDFMSQETTGHPSTYNMCRNVCATLWNIFAMLWNEFARIGLFVTWLAVPYWL